MIAALVTADRALVSANGDAAAIDARDSALLIEQLLALRIDAVTAFHAPLMSTAGERSREFAELAGHLGHEHGAARDVWVADSTGQLLFQTGSAPNPLTGHELPRTTTVQVR